ncbi:hypothetical protein E2F48_13705 [Arthrobacter crusticola]|uniref:Uncharacterized protein n=2 Tax=Arthrobacter crusticola TaxID=2547960 RepID=A0A4R5TUW8_9MICC|nr:hypothetical protein E2F48_13705 [Arthrobacter crusticola]
MAYRRRVALVIALTSLAALAMVVLPDLLEGAQGRDARPAYGSIGVLVMCFLYAYLIAFRRSLVFTRTDKKWKRMATWGLPVLALVLLPWHGFSVEWAGSILAFMVFLFSQLWFDSDVANPEPETD